MRGAACALLMPLGLAAAGCMPSPAMTKVAPGGRPCIVAHSRDGTVEWYVPALSRDNRHLERWCKAVGQPVVDSVPHAEFGSLTRSQPLALAVWNTDAGAGDVVRFLESELGLRCAGSSSARRGGAPHFVLMAQEALRRSPALENVDETWATPPPVAEEQRPGERIGIVAVARRCGLSLFYAPSARNGPRQREGSGEDKGNAILSTLPLSDFIAAELPFESARRVVVAATVHDAIGDSLRVVSVHLITTPQAWRVLTTANSSRARQAEAILRILERIERERAPRFTTISDTRAMPTVVAGDFNTWSRHESALRLLLRHFPESPRPLMERTRGPFPTDHLLFRDRGAGSGQPNSLVPGSYRRVEDRLHSDHNPIVVLFRFGAGPP